MADPLDLARIVESVNAARSIFTPPPIGGQVAGSLTEDGRELYDTAVLNAQNAGLPPPTIEEFKVAEFAGLAPEDLVDFIVPEGVETRPPGFFQEARPFTTLQASLLVSDVVGNVVEAVEADDRISLTNEDINLLELYVAKGLYTEWEVTPTGDLVRSSTPFADIPLGRLGDVGAILEFELNQRGNEFRASPDTLTQGEKTKAAYDQLLGRGLINPAVYAFLKNPNGRFTQQEQNELGARERDVNVLAFAKSVIELSDTVSADAAVSGSYYSSAIGSALERDFARNPLDAERVVHPYGFDPVVERQRQYDAIANEIFSDMKASPAELARAYIEEIGETLGIDIALNSSEIIHENADEQKRMRNANNYAKGFALKTLPNAIKGFRDQGMSPEEIGDAVLENSLAIATKYQEDYITGFEAELAKEQAKATGTLSGLKKTLADEIATNPNIEGKSTDWHPEVQQAAEDSIANLPLDQAKQVIAQMANRWQSASDQIKAQEEREKYTFSTAKTEVENFLRRMGIDDVSEIPKSVIERYASQAVREGELTDALKQGFVASVESDIRSAQEAEAFATAQERPAAFAQQVAEDMGILTPFSDEGFEQRFAAARDRIARAASRMDFDSIQEQREFIEQELTPGESTLGLMPFDVREQDFRRQVGSGELLRNARLFESGEIEADPFGVTDRLLGIRPPEPFATVDESEFLPFAVEEAGDDPNLLQFFRDEIPVLQQGFREAQNVQPIRENLESFVIPSFFVSEDFEGQLAQLQKMIVSEQSGGIGATGDPARIAELRRQIRGVENRRRIAEAGPAAIGQAFARAHTPAPPTRLEFFNQRRPELLEKFASTKEGVQSRLVSERNVEIEASNAETERRKKLRTGRTRVTRAGRR